MIRTGINTNEILFFDIETAPTFEKLDQYPEAMQAAWKVKNKEFEDAAGVYPEFSRIVCISVLAIDRAGITKQRSYTNQNEGDLLNQFFTDLNLSHATHKYLGGHNIKEFDIPFIIKRAAINRILAPERMQYFGKKPWELGYVLDSMEIWACNSFKNKFVSLRTLCSVFGLPDPKQDATGAGVAKLWYLGHIKKIAEYCEGDTLSAANVYAYMTGQELIKIQGEAQQAPQEPETPGDNIPLNFEKRKGESNR